MQVGAYGFNQAVSTNLDLSSTDRIKVRILRPDYTLIEKELESTAFQEPSGVDQPWIVLVPIINGDLSLDGVYQIQLIDITDGRNLPCSIGKFNVLPNLVIPTV